ncbi:MAG: hypothetical protein AAF627_20475 [Myxococcota bacterium]
MTFGSPRWLLVPYVLNILILVPVCYQMLFGRGVASVFEGQVAESLGLRVMVGALWCAILIASVAGIMWPEFFAPIVLVQIVYKFLWLVVFVVPLWHSGGRIPSGITLVFACIVVAYPVFFRVALSD